LEFGIEGGKLDGGSEVLEMLSTLTDFAAFKEMMMDFNRAKACGLDEFTGEALIVSSLSN